MEWKIEFMPSTQSMVEQLVFFFFGVTIEIFLVGT